MEPSWADLRRRVERAALDLPAGVVGPAVNTDDDIFGVLVALTGDGYTHRELKTVAEEVRGELLLIGDAASVNIYGLQPERIFVDYDGAKLAELGISPLQLRSILESVNTVGPGADILAGADPDRRGTVGGLPVGRRAPPAGGYAARPRRHRAP